MRGGIAWAAMPYLAAACANAPAPSAPAPETTAVAPREASETPPATPSAPPDAMADSPTPGDAGAPDNREAEVAWARSRWPKDFANIDTHPHAGELASWVAQSAEVEVYFTGEKHRCRKGLVKKGKNESEVELIVYTGEKRVKGERVRSFTEGTAGHFLWFGGGGGDEYQLADGTWEQRGGWGTSDLPPLGVLTRVDKDVARYDGMPLRISARCDGPMQFITCPDGVSQACNSCQNVTLDVSERPMGMLGIASIGGRGLVGQSCACPDVKNPDVARANRLFTDLEAWTRKKPGAARVAIYRSAAVCRTDKSKP